MLKFIVGFVIHSGLREVHNEPQNWNSLSCLLIPQCHMPCQSTWFLKGFYFCGFYDIFLMEWVSSRIDENICDVFERALILSFFHSIRKTSSLCQQILQKVLVVALQQERYESVKDIGQLFVRPTFWVPSLL